MSAQDMSTTVYLVAHNWIITQCRTIYSVDGGYHFLVEIFLQVFKLILVDTSENLLLGMALH